MTPDTYQKELDLQGWRTVDKSPLLPLFAWSETLSPQPLPIAARHIRRLTGVSPSTARLYAELAGFSMTGDR